MKSAPRARKLRAEKTSANILQKIQHFSPTRNLCIEQQQKWKSSFTLMMLIFPYLIPNNDRRVTNVGTPASGNFDIVVLMFHYSNWSCHSAFIVIFCKRFCLISFGVMFPDREETDAQYPALWKSWSVPNWRYEVICIYNRLTSIDIYLLIIRTQHQNIVLFRKW